MFKGRGLVTRPLGRPTMRRPIGIIRLAGRTPAELVLGLVRHLRRSFERSLG
jgi:hypothetical protein